MVVASTGKGRRYKSGCRGRGSVSSLRRELSARLLRQRGAAVADAGDLAAPAGDYGADRAARLVADAGGVSATPVAIPDGHEPGVRREAGHGACARSCPPKTRGRRDRGRMRAGRTAPGRTAAQADRTDPQGPAGERDRPIPAAVRIELAVPELSSPDVADMQLSAKGTGFRPDRHWLLVPEAVGSDSRLYLEPASSPHECACGICLA